MSLDLDELRSYGDYLDDLQGEVDVAAVIGVPLAETQPTRRWGRVLLAAAAVLVAVAVATALLLDDADDPTTTDTVGTTTSSTPPTTASTAPQDVESGIGPTNWDLVVEYNPDDRIGTTYDGTPEELAAAVREWPGVSAVTVINADRQTWIATVGERAVKDCALGDSCSPGLAVRTVDDDATAEVGVRLVELAGRVVATRPELAAPRVVDFLRNGLGKLGPEPAFDTGPLGQQQFLEELPAETIGGFREQVSPYDLTNSPAEAFGVRLENPVLGHPVVATVIVPAMYEIDLDAAPVFDEYAGLAPLEAHFFGGTIAEGEVVSLGSSGGGHSARLLTPNDGSYPLGTVASWAESSSDLRLVGLAGLPDNVAAVGTTFADGSEVWQRPLSGVVVFAEANAAGSPEPRLFVYAADGTVLFEFWNQQFQEPGAVEGALAAPSPSSAAVLEVGELGELARGRLTDGSALWQFAWEGLTRYDISSGEVTGFLPRGDAEAWSRVEGQTIWIDGGGTISSIDLGSMAITSTVPFPWDFRSGWWLPVPIDGGLWLDTTPQQSRSTIVRVDLETGELTNQYDVGTSIHGFAHDGAFWNVGHEEIARIDLATREMTVTPLSVSLSSAGGVTAPAGAIDVEGMVWVAVHESPVVTVARIDPNTGESVASAQVGAWEGHLGGWIPMVAGPGAIWVSGSGEPEIARVDTDTLEVTSVPVSHGFVEVEVFSDEIWILEEGAATRRDPLTGDVVESVTGIDEEDISVWFVTDEALIVLDTEGAVAKIPRG